MSGEYESETAYERYLNSLDDDQATYDDGSIAVASDGGPMKANGGVTDQDVKQFRATLGGRTIHVSRGLYELFMVQDFVSSIRDTGVVKAIDQNGGPPNPETVAMYSFAMVAEVVELANELGFKAWKPLKEANKGRIVDEFADVLAFLGILVHLAVRRGVNISELAEAYEKKSIINVDRQRGIAVGYEGSPKVADDGPNEYQSTVGLESESVIKGRWKALGELLEVGRRIDGPFTDLTVSTHPEVARKVVLALPLYSGPSRFVKGMQKKSAAGEALSQRQVRAVANILYRESIDQDY